MLRKFNSIHIAFVICTSILISSCKCEEDLSKENELKEETTNPYTASIETEMNNAIQEEFYSRIIERISKMNDLSPEDTTKSSDQIIAVIDDIHKAIKYPDNVSKFIKSTGFIRILSNNLSNGHSELLTKTLLLIKYMFDETPIIMDTLLPLNILDKLLDIFESNRNLGLKAQVLDILYKWLPNNPKAQARVMKTKGLETFYNQINKLDVDVIKTLMELFNKILIEHLNVRNDKAQVTRDDGEKLVLYQRIGFLERMSTPLVCNGLLNIFEMLWSYNKNESDSKLIVFDLLKSMKPFCLKIYTKKTRALKFFKELLKYVKDEDKMEYLEKRDVNITDTVKVIEEYLDTENSLDSKDEL